MKEKLPKGWKETIIGDIVILNPKNEEKNETEASFIPMKLVPTGYNQPIHFEIKKWGKIRKGYTHFKDGDVIVAKITPCFENSKAACITGLRNGIGAGSTEYHVLRPISNLVDARLLFSLVKTISFLKEGESKMTGTVGQKRVPKDFILNYPFPLPPLSEQHRIASRLDKLMPRIDAVRDRLSGIPGLIKRFRQSVLNAAVTGKLTEKWREEHPEVESAEILLEKIQQEKEKKYLEECEKAKQEGKKKPKKFRVNNEPIEIEDTIYSWSWTRLVNIAAISGGVTKGRKLKNVGLVRLPYLRVANVQDGYLDLKEIKEIEIKKEEQKRYQLERGDILFTEGGDRDKLGRGTVWKDEIKNCIHQNHIFKARLFYKLILPKYISLVTKSDFSKNYFQKFASQTVNLASINMTNLGDLPISICPLDEQKEIVRQVDRLFSFADKLERHYQKAKDKLDKLPQSVLAKAFRGELVPTEAELARKQGRDYETAQQLLERIKTGKKRPEQELKENKT